MQCVERSYEYLEALMLVDVLRVNGLDAHLFDENFVRLDWSAVLAYGSFRITVPDHQTAAAKELTDAYRQGKFMLAEEDSDWLECPHCASPLTQWNSRPRDWIRFALFMCWPLALLPLIAGYDFTHQFRCQTCHQTWRERPIATFSELQAQAEAALNHKTP